MKTILAILTILAISQANLNVISSLNFEDRQNIQNIKYNIANYGDIPYGLRTTGPLIVANPLNGCEELTNWDNPNKSGNELPFILVKRDECNFTKKSLNVQHAGGKVAIIMNNFNNGNDISHIILGDDGYGDAIHIPTIFISEADGIQLQELFERNHEKQPASNDYKPVMLAIEFNLVKQSKIDLKFFINPPEPANFELLNTFMRDYDALKNHATFEPFYEMYSCKGCNTDKNCIRGGNYCAIDVDNEDAGTGAQLAEEYLFQTCVNALLGVETWWKYVHYQYNECHQIPTMHQCTINRIVFNEKEDRQIKQCMFEGGDVNTEKTVSILEKQENARQNSNVYMWPSVLINNQKYKGSLFGTDVLEASCASLTRPSEKCQKIIQQRQSGLEHQKNDQKEGPNVTLILIVVFSVIATFLLFMVCVYKRMITQDISKEMKPQVDKMVTQYMALQDSKSNK